MAFGAASVSCSSLSRLTATHATSLTPCSQISWTASFRGFSHGRLSGLQTPQAVEGEVARTRRSFDLLADWLEADCVLAEGARLSTADAWRDWQAYGRMTGDGKIVDTQRAFTRILQERFSMKKSNGRNYVYGLRLKTAEELAAEEQDDDSRRLTDEEIDALI